MSLTGCGVLFLQAIVLPLLDEENLQTVQKSVRKDFVPEEEEISRQL